MPYITTLTQPIREFVQRLNTSETADMPEGDRIKVCAAFQRGDDRTGVWPNKMKRALINSLLLGHPIGTIMLVKPVGAMNTTNHYILDGGNRSRVIRDFLEDEFAIDTQDGRKLYSELDLGIQAEFANRTLNIMQVRILRDDPHDTIAQMFTNLNTMILALKDGELIKAHGWQGNIPIIEIAKMLVGGPWVTQESEAQFVEQHRFGQAILNVRNKWHNTFPAGTNGERETRRCDNIALMCSYLVSSLNNDLSHWDKKFTRLKRYLTPENNFSDEQMEKLLQRLNAFLDIIQEVDNYNDLFKSRCGFPKKTQVFSIWGSLIKDRMTPDFRTKTVTFYNNVQTDEDLRDQWRLALCGNGDLHVNQDKLDSLILLINTM